MHAARILRGIVHQQINEGAEHGAHPKADFAEFGGASRQFLWVGTHDVLGRSQPRCCQLSSFRTQNKLTASTHRTVKLIAN